MNFILHLQWFRELFFQLVSRIRSTKPAVILTQFNTLIQCRKYGLEDDTVDFIGHALALHLDDSYLDKPAKDFVDRVKVLICKLSLYAFVEWYGVKDSCSGLHMPVELELKHKY